MLDITIAFCDLQPTAARKCKSCGHCQVAPEKPTDVKYFRRRTLQSCGVELRGFPVEISGKYPQKISRISLESVVNIRSMLHSAGAECGELRVLRFPVRTEHDVRDPDSNTMVDLAALD